MTKLTKTQIIDGQESIISAHVDCLIELIETVNEYAESVGVEGWRLEPCFSMTSGQCCFLEPPDGYSGTLREVEAEHAIMAFRGMIAQATTN